MGVFENKVSNFLHIRGRWIKDELNKKSRVPPGSRIHLVDQTLNLTYVLSSSMTKYVTKGLMRKPYNFKPINWFWNRFRQLLPGFNMVEGNTDKHFMSSFENHKLHFVFKCFLIMYDTIAKFSFFR